jgi:hypothetical protein
MGTPRCQRSASTAATPPPAAAAEVTLVAACQLLNNPPPPHTSSSTAEQWCHDIDQLIITTINTPPHKGWQPPSAAHSRTLTMAHAPSPPQISSVAREPSTAHMSSATHAPAPLRVPAASIAMANLQAELNYRCAGKDSRITIEGQRERHHNIEGRNLEGEFNSLASAQEAHAMHSTRPPSSPRLSAGYMALAPPAEEV